MNEKVYTDTDIIVDAVESIGRLRMRIDMEEETDELRRVRNNLIQVLNAKQAAAETSPAEKPAEIIQEEDIN